MSATIAVALSGGIDSLVAAYLLKQQGNDIIGIHFLTGYEKSREKTVIPFPPDSDASGCRLSTPEPSHPMSGIGRQLSIPITLVDCRRIFQDRIINYFIDDYASGKTPNPCMLCNATIKFGVIAGIAKNLGASYLASGHYARIARTPLNGYRIQKGVDAQKDQSYFLSLLSRPQLAFARLPLGEMTKTEVRSMAQSIGLQALSTSESQDICFIPEGDYSDFLESSGRFSIKPGPIMTPAGTIIGEHRGLHRYTVGQRKGLNCPAERPYYVLRIDPAQNAVIVGFKEECYHEKCRLSQVNWMIPVPSCPMTVTIRLRYRHKAVPAVIEALEGATMRIRFLSPQPAVAPGQIAVAYDGDLIVAGGFIDA